MRSRRATALHRNRRTWGGWLSTLCAIAASFAAAVPAAAQNPATQFDVAAAMFDAPSPIVLRANNSILGVAINNGDVAVRVDASISISNDALTDAFVHAVTVTLGPKGNAHVPLGWNGTYFDVEFSEWRPLFGPLRLRFEVHARDAGSVDPAPGNNELWLSRDLRFYDFEVALAAPQPGESLEVGEEWAAFGTVTNQGNGPDAAVVTLSDPSPGWTFSLSEGAAEVPLDQPGSQGGFFAFATPGPTVMADAVGTVQVTVTSKAFSENTVTRTLTTPPVEQSGSLTVSFSPAQLTTTSNTVARFQATVQNVQNHEDRVRLQVVRQSGDPLLVPAISPSSTVTVPPGGTAAFAVEVPVGNDAQAGTSTWRVRAFSVEAGGEEAIAADLLTVTVAQRFGVGAAIESAPESVEPASTFEIRVELTNAGNGIDTLSATIVNAPGGWVATANQTTIGAGSSHVVGLKLTVPGSSPAGQRTVTVRAASEGQPSLFRELALPIGIQPIAIPELSTSLPARPIARGEQVDFPLTIRNGGNAPGHFELTAIVDATRTEPAADEWDVAAGPAAIDVAPGEAKTATLSVAAPATLQSTHDGLFVGVWASPTGDGPAAQIALRAAPAFPDLVAEIQGTSPELVYRSQRATLHFAVVNEGTADAVGPFKAKLEVRAGSDGSVLASREVTLERVPWQGPQKAAAFDVELPTNQARITARLVVDAQARVDESDETNNADEATIEPRNFDMAASAPADQIAKAGVALSFEGSGGFRATNVGSNATSVELRVASDAGWVAVEESFTNVAPGQTVSVPVNFVVPSDPAVEESVLRFDVQLANDASVVATKSMRIRVPDQRKPVFANVTVDRLEVAVDHMVRVNATVRDGLGVAWVKLAVVGPSGAVATKDMSASTPENFTVSTAFDAPGLYRAHVVAQDRSAARNENSTQAKPIVIRVVPPQPPGLNLSFPLANAGLRPGRPILVSVRATVPIQAAEYRVRGSAFPLLLSSPLQIPTDGWEDGVTPVLVRVTDSFGAVGEATYTFIVDGAPPVVSRIAFDADAIAPGLRLPILADVNDTAGLRHVTLRVSRTTGPATEAQMNETAPGTFEARAYLADATGVAVIAEDLVGNRAYAERTLAVAAAAARDADGDAPGAALGWIVLAGLCAAALRRRASGGARP